MSGIDAIDTVHLRRDTNTPPLPSTDHLSLTHTRHPLSPPLSPSCPRRLRCPSCSLSSLSTQKRAQRGRASTAQSGLHSASASPRVTSPQGSGTTPAITCGIRISLWLPPLPPHLPPPPPHATPLRGGTGSRWSSLSSSPRWGGQISLGSLDRGTLMREEKREEDQRSEEKRREAKRSGEKRRKAKKSEEKIYNGGGIRELA